MIYLFSICFQLQKEHLQTQVHVVYKCLILIYPATFMYLFKIKCKTAKPIMVYYPWRYMTIQFIYNAIYYTNDNVCLKEKYYRHMINQLHPIFASGFSRILYIQYLPAKNEIFM